MISRLHIMAGLISIALLCLSSGVSLAKVEASVVSGIDGYSRYEDWLPITLHAKSDKNTSGELSVSCYSMSSRSFNIPIELGSPSSISHTYYIQPGNYGYGSCSYKFYVGREKIASGYLSGNQLSGNNYLVALMSPKASSLDFIDSFTYKKSSSKNCRNCGQEFDVQLARLPLPSSPDSYGKTPFPDRWYGLAAVDVIILDRVRGEDFDAQTAKALKDWVKNGGKLIITGGSEVQSLEGSPVFKDMLPARMLYESEAGIKTVDIRGLDTSATKMEDDGILEDDEAVETSGDIQQGSRVQVIEVEPLKSAEIYKEVSGTPLVITRSYGKGRVTLVPMSFSQPELLAWNGKQGFWKTLTRENLPTDSGGNLAYRYDQCSTCKLQSNYSFMAVEEMKPPSMPLMFFIVLIYIFTISPLNYVILKKRKKLNMSWLVILIASVVFTLGNFTWALAHKGFKPVVNTMSAFFVPANASGEALVTSLSSVYTTFAGDYDIELPSISAAPAFLQIPRSFPVSSTNGATIRGINANMWGTNNLFIRDVVPLEKLAVAIMQEVEGKPSMLTITNNMDVKLTNLVYFARNRSLEIDDIAPHSSVTVNISNPRNLSATPIITIEGDNNRKFLRAIESLSSEYSSKFPKRGLYAFIEKPVYDLKINRSFNKEGVTYIVWEL